MTEIYLDAVKNFPDYWEQTEDLIRDVRADTIFHMICAKYDLRCDDPICDLLYADIYDNLN